MFFCKSDRNVDILIVLNFNILAVSKHSLLISSSPSFSQHEPQAQIKQESLIFFLITKKGRKYTKKSPQGQRPNGQLVCWANLGERVTGSNATWLFVISLGAYSEKFEERRRSEEKEKEDEKRERLRGQKNVCATF